MPLHIEEVLALAALAFTTVASILQPDAVQWR
jgi:hypothetical protein